MHSIFAHHFDPPMQIVSNRAAAGQMGALSRIVLYGPFPKYYGSKKTKQKPTTGVKLEL